VAPGLPDGRGDSGQSLHYHFVRKLFVTEQDRLGIGRLTHRFHRNPGIMTHVKPKRNPPAEVPSAVGTSRQEAILVG
jgi:hypothetical protein